MPVLSVEQIELTGGMQKDRGEIRPTCKENMKIKNSNQGNEKQRRYRGLIYFWAIEESVRC